MENTALPKEHLQSLRWQTLGEDIRDKTEAFLRLHSPGEARAIARGVLFTLFPEDLANPGETIMLMEQPSEPLSTKQVIPDAANRAAANRSAASVVPAGEEAGA